MIWAEVERLPDGFLPQLIEYRHYAKCKAMREQATTPAARQALPDSPLMTLVNEITFELVEEARLVNAEATRLALEADAARRASAVAAQPLRDRRRRKKRRHG